MLVKYVLFVTILSLIARVEVISAEEPTSESTGRLPKSVYDMSIEELMEVTIVTSASRLPQESGDFASPVTIITAQDIHHSGLTSIPEILRFACGVDVIQIDRRRYAIGVRGLQETISDRTTLLINGQLADNPLYGGPDFQGLPLLVEDIDRIEVFRSPGSASWGANAVTGVINIVTKKPTDVLGGMAKTTLTEFGDSYTHLRWAEKQDDFSWRISVGYEDIISSEDAIDGTADYKSIQPSLNPLIGFDTYEARDFARNQRTDTEAYWDVSDLTRLSFGIGHTHIDAGDFELGGYYPKENIREDHVRSYTKLDHNFDNGTSGYLRWSGKYWNTNWPMAVKITTQQHELEGQYNLAPKDGHKSSVGASFRWDHINTQVASGKVEQAHLEGIPLDEYNVGLFAVDRWELSDRWTLESQIRGDWYSGTRADWSGRLSAFRSLDQAKNQVLRFAAARAFRAPLAALRKASVTRVNGGGLFLLNATAPGNLENEETFALETGYSTKLSKTLILRVNGFYQQFNKLIGYRRTTNAFNQSFATADNIDGADAWGGDVELAFKEKWGRISTWYSFNEFEPDRSGQDFGAFLPAKHKAGLRFRRDFLPDWTFSANYSFADAIEGNPSTANNDVDASSRLDLTISKVLSGKGEIMMGVRDLLDKTHDPVSESITLTGHEVPGRSYFLSLLLKF